MERKVVSGIMLALLLMGMLTLAFNIQPVKAEPTTWTVDDDGPADFQTIQEAINAANPEDTIYVHNGTYYENVAVNKNNLTLSGESKDATIIDGGGTGTVISVTADNVTVSGFMIQNSGQEFFDSGIYLEHSSNDVLSGNIIRNNSLGIYLLLSSNNSISGNNITNNRDGVWLRLSSNYNSISGNTITNNAYGIQLDHSSNNILCGNVMNDNTRGFGVWGLELSNFIQAVDVSNLVNGKPVYYLVNRRDLLISPEIYPQVGYLGLVNSSNITVERLTLTNNWQGLLLAYTNNSTITNNNITNNWVGVWLRGSSNNSISGNNVTHSVHGVWLRGSSNNSISGNNITNNLYGIFLWDSSNYNSISGNNIQNIAGSLGVQLDYSSNNSISGNNITNNACGISLGHSSNNSISGNNVTHSVHGVWLSDSSDNVFYHNNFIDNDEQVSSYQSVNVWDDGYPSGGNYWSDYSVRYPLVKDEYQGENQDVLGSDGIWDSPYEIDDDNQDNYPLMEPWSPKPPTPQEALEELIETIETSDLPKGTENSLTSKLEAAIHLLNKGNENGAIHKLMDFINQVEAQRGKKLTSEQADQLTSEAQRIIDLTKGE